MARLLYYTHESPSYCPNIINVQECIYGGCGPDTTVSELKGQDSVGLLWFVNTVHPGKATTWQINSFQFSKMILGSDGVRYRM